MFLAPKIAFDFDQPSPLNQSILDTETGEVTNLISEYSFSQDLSESLETHSAKQAYWESLASEVTRQMQEFENVGYAQWIAHARYYSKLSLKGMGEERPLLDDIRDLMIKLYSEKAKEEIRIIHCRYAYDAFLMLEKKSRTRVEQFRNTEDYRKGFDVFKETMYSYLLSDPPWFYERVVSTLYKLKEYAEKMRAIAKAFDKRSYCLKEFVELERAKFGNIGPLSVQEIVGELSKRVEKRFIDEKELMRSFKR